MTLNIGSNIKKLRTEKGATQEQLAEHLSITYQSVSKWENSVTSPDLHLIPAIASYFDVSIDELFQPNIQGYKNKAARLFALYEHRRTKQNFDKADAEFEQLIAEDIADADDYHKYGMLNQFHATNLNKKAENLLGKAIEIGHEYAECQLQELLENLGRHKENIDKYEAAVQSNPENVRNWFHLVCAYTPVDREKALALAKDCMAKFPNDVQRFLFRCGYIHYHSKNYDEAEAYFNKSIALNPDCGSTLYHMAFMYTDAKNYEKAIWAWEQVIALLGRLGLSEEEVELQAEWPRREIANLQKLLGGEC